MDALWNSSYPEYTLPLLFYFIKRINNLMMDMDTEKHGTAFGQMVVAFASSSLLWHTEIIFTGAPFCILQRKLMRYVGKQIIFVYKLPFSAEIMVVNSDIKMLSVHWKVHTYG